VLKFRGGLAQGDRRYPALHHQQLTILRSREGEERICEANNRQDSGNTNPQKEQLRRARNRPTLFSDKETSQSALTPLGEFGMKGWRDGGAGVDESAQERRVGTRGLQDSSEKPQGLQARRPHRASFRIM
jgi:hypothetical protein